MCNKQLNYVALGDCLTRSFLAFFLDGFAYRFCRYLECNNCCVCCRNLGCSGITSTGLLKQLKCDSEVRCAVKKADVLTISVGGNNLLKSAFDNFSCINRVLAGIGVERFARDWPKILCKIRKELCSDAEIYVMNLYNPYCPNDPNYKIADYFICGINSIIEDRALMEAYCYDVVDIYCRFERNKDKEWTFLNNIFRRDPHPNWEGNQQMFLALVDEYTSCDKG